MSAHNKRVHGMEKPPPVTTYRYGAAQISASALQKNIISPLKKMVTTNNLQANGTFLESSFDAPRRVIPTIKKSAPVKKILITIKTTITS